MFVRKFSCFMFGMLWNFQVGRTPLDVAKERKHYLIVELLKNVAVNNVGVIKTSKRKRIRKSSYAGISYLRILVKFYGICFSF